MGGTVAGRCLEVLEMMAGYFHEEVQTQAAQSLAAVAASANR